MTDPVRPGSQRRRLLSFSAGGWIIILALLLVTAATLGRVREMLHSRGGRATGDGRDPATYGFDLSGFNGERSLLAASGLPRDGIPVLDFPRWWSVARVDSLAHAGRNKYLVSGDRVIGVVRHGRARAYPLMILNWHEVVNDTLGGTAIAVTYGPLCDAAVVYSLESTDPRMMLGHSGLMYNSSPLLYDRRAGHAGESLFHQLTGRAMAGPAAARAETLSALPATLMRWADWKLLHPETTILWRDPARSESYMREPYSSYFGDNRLRFPVSPLPGKDPWPTKTPCLALGRGDRCSILPLPLLATRVDPGGTWRTTVRGRSLIIHWRESPATAWAEAADGGDDPVVRYGCWFAWFAAQNGRPVILD